MKKYTQEEFDQLPVANGKKHCPTGDYTEIKVFGKWCRFGERCRFGECCQIEGDKEFCNFLKFEGFGSEKRCTYFFKLTDGKIYIRCGCFSGYLEEFREKVKETHGETKFAKEYLMIADLAESHFKEA